MKNTTANRLQYATSPYLLQHAHNPVDWYEWGNEALDKARREDKPILVSIGYSACHWCHVMERESFEDEDIAKIMNEHYVCIKVDREERPDIDQIYMDAVQALGVNGGWPLNVVLTPDQKPFFGGTYFGPEAWIQVLSNIQQAYINNRAQVDSTADQLGLHLLRSDVARFRQEGNDSALTADIEEIFQHLSARFDRKWGGMERAPKFIMPSVWQWLLRYYTLTKNETALQQVLLTLNKAGMGGIYDPVGGGFARYSVDGEWFAPHFEKMLYDNAQLLSLYSEAYAVSGEQDFKTIVYETFDWLQREMTDANGGFYSALDADSEGEEGKFYVWTAPELKTLLGADYNLIAEFYSITDEGNWEHGNNILFRHAPVDAFLRKHSLTHADWTIQLENIKKILLKARANRVRPGLDDKIIAAWNAMTVSGLTDAYRIFGDQRFLSAAIRNMRFIENELMIGGKIFRSYKGHRSTIAGFLDDYAYVIQGCLKLYQATFDEYWIHRAAFLLTYTLDEFFDPTEGYFFYTAHSAEGLIARKKEIFDNVIPSSNALMAQNLFQLGVLFDREDWKEKAVAMTNGFAQLIRGEPNYMSYWAMVYTEIRNGLSEVVVMGDASHTLRTDLQKNFYPFALFMGAQKSGTLPLLVDKTAEGDVSTIYVCHNKTCRLPVHSVHEALPLMV